MNEPMDEKDELDRTDSESGGPTIRTIGVVLLIAGLIGEVAALILSVEKYWLLTNPFYTPSCDIGSVISCGAIMDSDQSAAFGFPNPYLGLAGFGVVAATGAAILAGARLAAWYRISLLGGTLLAIVFVCWLMVQSLFVLKALCPYCMAVWAVTFTTAWYAFLHVASLFRDRLSGSAGVWLDRLAGNHSAIITGALTLIAILVAVTAWINIA